jgi:hypothetical protein
MLNLFAQTDELRIIPTYIFDAQRISRWKDYLLILKALKIVQRTL